MKNLYLLRHAKSSWTNPSMADFDRPLNDRGLLAAPFVGELIANRGIDPDTIISSPAKRAIQTATIVKQAGNLSAKIVLNDRVYDASLSTLIGVLQGIDPELRSALLVGHNPGLESLVRSLTGRVEPMPTAAIASIIVHADKWNDISSSPCELEFVLRPKEEADKLRG